MIPRYRRPPMTNRDPTGANPGGTAGDVGIGLRVVGHFHLLAVPEQFPVGKTDTRFPMSTILESGPE